MSGAATLALGEAQALSIDFTDDYFFNQTGHYGSALVRDTTTPANNYDSNPYDLLTYTSPSLKMTRGPDGLLRFGAHNLLLHSEAFDNAVWVKSNNTITTNVVSGPNGSATADELVETAATGQHYVYQTITTIIGVQYAVSVYAKSSTSSWIVVAFEDSGGTTGRYVNLSSGTLHTTLGSPDSSAIEDAGGGWYKITIVQTAVATTSYITVYTVAGDGASLNYAGDTGNKRYLFGAHVRRTPSDDTYLATTTAARYALPYEWDVNGDPLGLLVEEQRTNLQTYSTTFENAIWTGSNAVADDNNTASPTGETTATLVTPNSGSAEHSIISNAFPTTTTHTLSVFAKTNGYHIALRFYNAGSDYCSAAFVLDGNGTATAPDITGATYSGAVSVITPVGDGWYRCSLTCTRSSGTTINAIDVNTTGSAAFGSNGAQVFNADGTSGVYLFGAQLEAGSFPTSYIPTLGSTVTRAADNITLATSRFALGAERSVYVKFRYSSDTSLSNWIVQLDDGTSNNRDYIFCNGVPITARVWNGGVLVANFDSGSAAFGGTYKTAYALANNDFAMTTDGGAVQTDTSVAVPAATRLLLGLSPSPVFSLNGHIQSLLIIPRRVSNADLQTLTLTGQLP